jgi:glycine oxidase
MLAPLAESGPEDPLLGLGVRARDLYHELAPVLEEETGIDIGLWSDGILQLAFTDEEAHQLRSDIAWQRQRGFKSDWLSPEGLHDECPWVSPQALGALHAPEDGALTASALLQALLASAEKHGARLVHDQRVEALDIQQGKVTGVRTSTETYSAGAVVLAAGCWSGRIGGLPRPLSVEPVRGQMAAFAWPADAKPGIAYAGSHYVLKVGDEAFAGSTMEHAGFDASVTEEGHAEDLWYATGHGRNGILWAGLTGELIARLLTGEGVDHDLTPIDPARFWKSFQAHAPPEDPAEGDSGGNQPNG